MIDAHVRNRLKTSPGNDAGLNRQISGFHVRRVFCLYKGRRSSLKRHIVFKRGDDPTARSNTGIRRQGLDRTRVPGRFRLCGRGCAAPCHRRIGGRSRAEKIARSVAESGVGPLALLGPLRGCAACALFDETTGYGLAANDWSRWNSRMAPPPSAAAWNRPSEARRFHWKKPRSGFGRSMAFRVEIAPQAFDDLDLIAPTTPKSKAALRLPRSCSTGLSTTSSHFRRCPSGVQWLRSP